MKYLHSLRRVHLQIHGVEDSKHSLSAQADSGPKSLKHMWKKGFFVKCSITTVYCTSSGDFDEAVTEMWDDWPADAQKTLS